MHLWVDRPITSLPHAVLVGRFSQWIFNESELMSQYAQGQCRKETQGVPTKSADMVSSAKPYYYQVVISAAHRLIEKDKRQNRTELLREIFHDLHAVFPIARQAKLLHWRLVSMPRAVFSLQPGVDGFRPSQKTAISNLFLAGDWTATGWPGTMEGAVRSGYLAAEELLKYLGQ